MELSERKSKILCLAVEEYIKDSSPITSNGVKASFDVSTATLRNELNALEAMGFLRQLHTSGGRIPTAQGYRYYVEHLLKNINATQNELEEVKDLISSRTNSLMEIVTGIANIVSKATNYPTVVIVNGLDNLVLNDFKIIPLLDEKCMVLIGTNSGYITNTLDVKATQENCNDASNYLTKYFRGETVGFMLENIDQIEIGMNNEIESFQNIVDNLISGIKKMNNRKLLNVHSGMAKLLESNDTKDAKKVIDLIEEEDKLVECLNIPKDSNNITIDVADDDNCSVVKAPITVRGSQLASIGVIGPQKMDYAGIASALKVVIDELEANKGE
ncbi:MAG: heat-inducible transcription repressor HrcA [Clostridia bacterium]|nr:heat-inducible transcription repressor HrcA [Clostridia bacterium]